jgi:hypothetical protein
VEGPYFSVSRRQLSTRRVWQAGHGRRDEENDCFNTVSMHWGLDHCFKHNPAAIVNFVLTLFLVSVLLQCFWQRNLKASLRARIPRIVLPEPASVHPPVAGMARRPAH